MASPNSSTETAPLLGTKDGEAGNRKSDRSGHDNEDEGSIDTSVVVQGDNVSEPDLERRSSVGKSREAQFQGNPEIRAQLKYILPAMSIGV